MNSRNGQGVSVNLQTGVNTGGGVDGDTIINIENLIGTDRDDNLTGDNNSNILTGLTGDDILDGGAGDDTAVFEGAFTDYTVTEANGVLTVTDINSANGNEGTDTLTNIEYLQFGNLTVAVQTLDNPINGTQGADTLAGTVGTDLILGLDDDDVVEGLEGDDCLLYTSPSPRDATLSRMPSSA